MNFKRITSSTNAILTGVYRITKVRLVAGSGAAASCVLYDKLTTGSPGDAEDFCTLSADTALDNDKESFNPQEGVTTSKGLSAVLTGAGAVLYIYFC